MEAIRVLLVDDEVKFTETLGYRLEARGFAIVTAASGNEAIEKFDNEDFDVVLLDLVMPGMDGFETLREIKSRHPLAEVIILSGKGTEEMAIEGMQRGAFDFLTKPPDIRDIVEKINGAYARKVEHQARIQRALEAGREKEGAVQVVPAESPETVCPAEDGVSRHGRLLVLGQESDFSEALVEYAVEMAERLSYEVLALNTMGFSKGALRDFPSAREKVCSDFRIASEENVVPFCKAVAEKGIPFTHMVKLSGPDEAIKDIQQEVGKIDFVISEDTDGLTDPGSGPEILVYSPA